MPTYHECDGCGLQFLDRKSLVRHRSNNAACMIMSRWHQREDVQDSSESDESSSEQLQDTEGNREPQHQNNEQNSETEATHSQHSSGVPMEEGSSDLGSDDQQVQYHPSSSSRSDSSSGDSIFSDDSQLESPLPPPEPGQFIQVEFVLDGDDDHDGDIPTEDDMGEENGDEDDQMSDGGSSVDPDFLRLYTSYLQEQRLHEVSSASNKEKELNIHPVLLELMCIMKKEALPKRCYDQLLDWAYRASIAEFDFSDTVGYKTLLAHMKKRYKDIVGSGPKKRTVNVGPEYPPMHVYYFDILECIMHKLKDKGLMKDALWEFDVRNSHTATGERKYSQLNTGVYWEEAQAEMMRKVESVPEGQRFNGLHILIPIILFDDSTFCDNIGRLEAQPLLMTIGNICDSLRRTAKAYDILGMIPRYPKTSKEREEDRNSLATKEKYLKFYHHCLEAILEPLREMENENNGIPAFLDGFGEVRLHPSLCMVGGDTKGQESMCGHYNAHSSVISRMVRDCDIPQEFGDDPVRVCTMTEQQYMETEIRECIDNVENRVYGQVQESRDRAQAISQNLVIPYYFNFTFGGSKNGVFGSLPYELLHLYYLGLQKYMLTCLFQCVEIPSDLSRWCKRRWKNPNQPGAGLDRRPTVRRAKRDKSGRPAPVPNQEAESSKEIFNKVEFERRVRVVTQSAKRQSDKDMPRTPFKNGVTELTRLTGQEYMGLILVTLAAMKGCVVGAAGDMLEKAYSLVLFLSMSLHMSLTRLENTETQLHAMSRKISVFMSYYSWVVGPMREFLSKSGLRISKFHGLKHFPHYIRRYGNAYNFFGGYWESHLKCLLKANTSTTSRRQDRIDLDLMNRHFEMKICDSALKELEDMRWFDINRAGDVAAASDSGDQHVQDDDGEENLDKYLLSKPAFVAKKVNADRWVVRYGRRRFENAVYPSVEGTHGDSWVKAVLDYCDLRNQDNGGIFDQIEFSYSCRARDEETGKKETFRCHPNYYSYPWDRRSWHDWAMVNWEHGSEENPQTYTSAARLRLWAKLVSSNDGSNTEICCAVQSMSSVHTRQDSMLPCFSGDYVEDMVRVIEADQIATVAYVLPSIGDRIDEFPNNAEEANYFIIVPPRGTDWVNLGWDDPKLNDSKRRHGIDPNDMMEDWN